MRTLPYAVLLYTPANKGAILEYVAHLAAALPADRAQVFLQTGECSAWPPDWPALPGRVSNLALPSPARYGTLRWALSRYAWALANGARRLALARQLKADIIHMQTVLPWADGFLAPLERRRSRVVCTVHDVAPHLYRLPRQLDRRLRGQYYRACAGLLFHSAANAAQFEQEYGFAPRASAIVPHGLAWRGPVTEHQRSEARRCLGLQDSQPVILFFGNLRPGKGAAVMTDAFAEVRTRDSKAFLLVVGSSAPHFDVAALEERLQRLPNGSYRWIRGWLSDSERETCFHAASVVVLPYTSFSSQSGVLLMAYRYACPVVVSDVGSLGETVANDRSGLVVPPGQPDELARAILHVLGDGALQMELRDRIVGAAQEKYAWPVVAERTAQFYERLLGGGLSLIHI